MPALAAIRGLESPSLRQRAPRVPNDMALPPGLSSVLDKFVVTAKQELPPENRAPAHLQSAVLAVHWFGAQLLLREGMR